MDGPCCAPGDDRHDGAPGLPLDAVPAGAGTHPETLVDVAAGTFRMGDESVWAYPGDGEGPVRRVRLDPFEIAPHAVSNADFAAFVDATGLAFTWADDVPGLVHGYVDDPFGNRIELVDVGGSTP